MSTHTRNRRIVAAAGFGIFQRSVQAVCTLLVMPLLLHALGAAEFGVWGAAVSLAWLSGLVDIGTGNALVTMVARSAAANDMGAARRQITSALTIGTSLALVIFLLAFVAWISGMLKSSAAPYLIALAGLTLHIPLNCANNVWMALQKGYISVLWELVQTALTMGSLALATAFTKDVVVYVALVYGGLVIANLASLIHLFVLHPELRPRARPESLASLREVGESGIMFFVLGIAGSLSFMLDNVLALQLLGPEASALMTIVLRICMTAVSVLVVLSQPLWPAFAEAAHQSDRKWIRRNLLRGSALLVGTTAAGCAVLLLFGERLMQLWLHANLGFGAAMFWAISAWLLTQALVRVPILLLNGLMLIRFQIGVFSVATAIALALKFILAPRLGVAGILWGTSIPVFFIAIPASVWRIYQWADRAARLQAAQVRLSGAEGITNTAS